jgi:hypothetical protein
VSAWKNAPDAPGLWWVRGDLASFDAPQPREIYARDGKLYVRAAAPDDGVPVPQGWQWCRVVPPDTYAEIVRERNHYRERAAEHHRRGDEARHEAATLRRRVEALESALREVCESRHEDRWCSECGASWGTEHPDGCHIGRALAVLRGGA